MFPSIIRLRIGSLLAGLVSAFLILFAGSCGIAEADEDVIECGTMQIFSPGELVDAGDELLLVRFPEMILYHVNKESFVAAPFCQDPSCHHIDDKCAALGAQFNLENYRGTIYATDIDSQLLKKRGDHFVRMPGIQGTFIHSRGKLYTTYKTEIREYSKDYKLERVFPIENFGICFRIGDYLYGSGGYSTRRIDLNEEEPVVEELFRGQGLSDGKRLYQLDIRSHQFYKRDLNGNNPVEMFDAPVLMVNFDKDYLYFRYYIEEDLIGERSHEIYRVDKDGKEEPELIATLPEAVWKIYTVPDSDWIYVVATENFLGDMECSYYAVQVNSGDIRKFQFYDD